MRRSALILLVVLVGSLLILLPSVLAASPSEYAGSQACRMCHSTQYNEWKDTVHGRFVVDAAENPEAVPGEYEHWSNLLGFDKEDVRFVLLSKPGFLTTSELVGQKGTFGVPADDYPILWGAWDFAKNEWEIEAESYNNGTPWLSVCAGCHVTGLQVPTEATPDVARSFVEGGITCENCHGPAKAHVENPTKVKPVVDVSAVNCGQCHERGASVATKPGGGTFGYPYGVDGQYRPGQDLAAYYVTATPELYPNWFWPTGHAKNSHHMQFPEWLMTGHAKAADSIKNSDHGRESCLECHSADYILAPENAKPSVAEVNNGITCQVCHDSHNPTKLVASEDELCQMCHRDESNGDINKTPHHSTAQLFAGSVHDQAGVTCVDCHMPKVTGNPHKGSHLMQVVIPEEAAEYNMPDSCTPCHGASLEYLQAQIDKRQDEIKVLADRVKSLLDRYEGDKDHTYYKQAKYNYQFVLADGSMGFHNYQKSVRLLKEAQSLLLQL
ncbi:MAG: ammonia-forming cytochrome c nitrite reductase subunit c552 [Firmicutes bacterium]|nr:ammonia-forming cytochrome c nitrite reductase subunit c552 [Bacillota bacterium]